jgi:phenylacetate-CoA ligase
VEAIDGRIEDYVVTPDGRRVGRMDHAFKDTPELREAQILQHDRDSIRVLLVPIESFGKQARAVVEAELRSRLGHRIAIEFEIVKKIPRLPNGKFRAVISEVGKIDVP